MEREQELADFAILMLRHGSRERYALVDGFPRIIGLAIDAVLEAPVDARSELEGLMRVGVSLQQESPTSSGEIIRAIAAHARARLVLGIDSGSQSLEIAKRRALMSGGRDKLAAPIFGECAPEGSLKVKSLLKPGEEPLRAKPARR
jgi:hypothetical protein